MYTVRHRLMSAVTAIILAAAILWSSNLASRQITGSALVRQSRILSVLMSESDVGFGDILANPRNLEVMTRFAAALADAYIQFDFIPTDEARALIVILESLDPEVRVSRFEFSKYALEIYGAAPSMEPYENTLDALRRQALFLDVVGSRRRDVEGQVFFTIICSTGSSA